ncbi:MAG: helix-turn-helix domain-containing protein [Bacteroidetes bacterium]|nr:helix-turn-helix domain-containing protein [Bacteroidota bacterium]
MKKVVFLIADGTLKPSSLFNAIEIFEKANEYLRLDTGKDYYDIRLAGTNLRQPIASGLFSLQVEALKPEDKADLIILPAYAEQGDFAIRNSSDALEWVADQYRAGAELASLCTGTFLLAATGLLDGKPCATHWRAADYFRMRFPDLDLHTNKIVTDQQGIYTAGGGISSLNLALYIIEKYNGREAALYCARLLQIDIDRNSQSPFILFEGLKDHKDEIIREVQLFIEQHVSDRITVDQLASRFAMDRINFSRRFKKATQLSPADYVQRIKVEGAKRLFESTGMQINEVMYEVGYGDVKSFRHTFKKVAGMTPADYRNKFNKVMG